MIPFKRIATLISPLPNLRDRGELSSGIRLDTECLPFQDVFFPETDLAWVSEYLRAKRAGVLCLRASRIWLRRSFGFISQIPCLNKHAEAMSAIADFSKTPNRSDQLVNLTSVSYLRSPHC
jgi:hypothetical protein